MSGAVALRLERQCRLMLWVALLTLPLLAVAHAFEHPVVAAASVHDCPICAHVHHGAAPIAVARGMSIVAAPAAPRSIDRAGCGPARAFVSVYLGRGPPPRSFGQSLSTAPALPAAILFVNEIRSHAS